MPSVSAAVSPEDSLGITGVESTLRPADGASLISVDGASLVSVDGASLVSIEITSFDSVVAGRPNALRVPSGMLLEVVMEGGSSSRGGSG
jgi:hypothetical protein